MTAFQISVLVADANAANGLTCGAGRRVVCEQSSRSRPARISYVFDPATPRLVRHGRLW